MKFKAKKDSEGRLDQFLSKSLGKSRSAVQKLIKQGKVLVDEKSKSSGYVIRKDDVVDVEMPTGEDKLTFEGKLNIVDEDDSIIVVNKEAGMVVYPPEGKKEISVQGILDPKIDIEGDERAGIVHRLDRDTSGLLVVAKTEDASENLKKQFKERKTEKGYFVLVFSHIEPKKGEINIPLGRSKVKRLKRTAEKNGKEAITRYEVIEYIEHENQEYTLLDVEILTGRTHQIRVHMQSIGHPVVGDKDYSSNKYKQINKKEGFSRQFLHAYKLGFEHPETRKWRGYKIELAKDLGESLEKLRS